MHHFNEETRRDPAFGAFAEKLTITAPPEIDQLYPKLRPARVTVTTPRGKFVRQADEALGSRLVPLDDAGLEQKFIDNVEPVLGEARAKALVRQLWDIETISDIRPLVEATALGTLIMPDIKTIGFIGIGNMGRADGRQSREGRLSGRRL